TARAVLSGAAGATDGISAGAAALAQGGTFRPALGNLLPGLALVLALGVAILGAGALTPPTESTGTQAAPRPARPEAARPGPGRERDGRRTAWTPSATRCRPAPWSAWARSASATPTGSNVSPSLPTARR